MSYDNLRKGVCLQVNCFQVIKLFFHGTLWVVIGLYDLVSWMLVVSFKQP